MATVEWTVRAIRKFAVTAMDTSESPVITGNADGVDYKIVIPKPAGPQFVSQGCGLNIWHCDSFCLQTKHPDDEVATVRHKVISSELVDQALQIVNVFLAAVRYCTRQLQINEYTKPGFLSNVSVLVCIDSTGEQWAESVGFGSPILPNHAIGIQSFMASGGAIDTQDSMLYDADGALESGDVTRAVLYAAIAAEILIKRYLTSKGYTVPGRVSVASLFDNPLETHGHGSLKNTHPVRYENVDYLFRTRNKIAHNGCCGYRTDASSWVTVDGSKAKEFISNIRWVFYWLEGRKILNSPGYVDLNSTSSN